MHTVFETLITIQDRKLKRFHGGFFELEMLEISARAFLLKIIIRTWSCLYCLIPQNWKKNHQKDLSRLKIIKILHVTRDTRKTLKTGENEKREV